MKEAFYLKISGIVQGVFFRQSTQQKAIELNISGWVRNCEDGSVEVEAEGEDLAMRNFIAWCYQGPERAVVYNVEVKTIGLKNYSGFVIRR